MTTSAVLGASTEFKLGDGASPDVFTKVAEVLRMGSIGSTATEVDVTNFDSGNNKEYIGGLQDGESLEVEMNWIAGNTQQEALRDAVSNTITIQVVWPDASTAAFSLVLLGFTRAETTPEGQLMATITGRISGAIVWA